MQNLCLAVDASAEALALNRENIAVNNLPLERVDFLEGDVFQLLRKFRDSRQLFDMIVLDPPKFAPTAALAERAARGYKDINLLAFKLLRPRWYSGYIFLLGWRECRIVSKYRCRSSP